MRASRTSSIEPFGARGQGVARATAAAIADAAVRRESRTQFAFIATAALTLAVSLLALAIGITDAVMRGRMPIVEFDPWGLGTVFWGLVALAVALALAAAALGGASVRAERRSASAHEAAMAEQRPRGHVGWDVSRGLVVIREDLAARAARDLPTVDDELISRDDVTHITFPDLGKHARYFAILSNDGTAIRCIVADSIPALDLASNEVERHVALEGGAVRWLPQQQRHWWLEGGAPFFPAVRRDRARA